MVSIPPDVTAVLDAVAVRVAPGLQLAADTFSGLENGHADAPFGQHQCGAEPGQTGADHHDPSCRRMPSARRKILSHSAYEINLSDVRGACMKSRRGGPRADGLLRASTRLTTPDRSTWAARRNPQPLILGVLPVGKTA